MLGVECASPHAYLEFILILKISKSKFLAYDPEYRFCPGEIKERMDGFLIFTLGGVREEVPRG